MTQPARLYLITPALDALVPFRPALETALASKLVDCVLLRRTPSLRRDDIAAAIGLIQRHDAAAMIEGEPREAARAGADGLHLAGSGPALQDALERLKPDGIVGVGGLNSRDLAMEAGETGIDYVMFGEPRPDGFVPPLLNTLDVTRWWAEIFNVPCVAYAETLDAVSPLVDAGAEFVALGDALWRDGRGPDVVLASLAGVLSRRAFA